MHPLAIVCGATFARVRILLHQKRKFQVNMRLKQRGKSEKQIQRRKVTNSDYYTKIGMRIRNKRGQHLEG